jgi:chaperone modulatory protein CbpM
MTTDDIVNGELLGQASLSLEELARACAVQPEWIVQRIEAGFWPDGSMALSVSRFSSQDLRRARRMRQIERDFDANPELAALVADMLDELDRLRARLRAAGLNTA